VKKWFAFLIIALVVSQVLHAQEVHIPDHRFLAALIGAGVDMDGNGTVEPEEAAMVETLDISDRNIHDISGIWAFTSLKVLDCSRNYLTELDLSESNSLEKLCCAVNCLKSLDLSRNPALTDLICPFNHLTGLDLSRNQSLRLLDCSANRLGSLDVSRNPVLEYLDCHDTRLAILHLKHNPLLKYLRCGFNFLSQLELTENHSLRYLDCLCNGLKTLDVSENMDLITLGCSFNRLTSLDVSKNPRLDKLFCGYNQLNTLDITTNPELSELDVSGMKSLRSICVATSPFPPEGMNLFDADSPNISFIDCLPPQIELLQLQSDPPLMEVQLSENGTIYLVTEGTGKDSVAICENCICSATMTAHESKKIPTMNAKEGCYWLIAIDPAGNISDPVSFNSQSTGIERAPGENIRIYPNPSNGFVSIESRLPGRIDIHIMDLNLRAVLSTRMDKGLINLDISTLPPSTYLVILRSGKTTSVRKITRF